MGEPVPLRWRWPRIALVLAALVLPTAIAWFYFVVLAGNGERNLIQQTVYTLGKIVQFSLPGLYLLLCDRRWPGRPRSLWSGVGTSFLLAVIIISLAVAIYAGWLRQSRYFVHTPARIAAKVGEMGLDTPARYLAFGFFISVGHSFLEEYYWRWFVFGRLREWLRRWPAILLSALGFTAHHVIILAVFFPGRFLAIVVPLSVLIVIGGILWAWLYDRSGSLLGPWLCHALIDAGLLAIGWDLWQRAV